MRKLSSVSAAATRGHPSDGSVDFPSISFSLQMLNHKSINILEGHDEGTGSSLSLSKRNNRNLSGSIHQFPLCDHNKLPINLWLSILLNLAADSISYGPEKIKFLPIVCDQHQEESVY